MQNQGKTKLSENNLIDLDLSGVKWEILEEPNIAIQTTQKLQTKQNRTATTIVPTIAPVAPLSVETVSAMAMRPNDIHVLIRMIGEFNHPLRAGATNVVLPHIAKAPNGILIITDIPGSDDDATGNILSGATGELLDKMLNAIGMGRDNVHIVPLLFWRTPGGRTPVREELDLARPFVNRLVDFINPKFILTLGDLATKEILGQPLAKSCGKISEMSGGINILPIYHPNYMILKPLSKREVWDALQELQKLLKI